MKKFIQILTLLLLFNTIVEGQSIIKDANGNYSHAKKSTNTTTNATATSNTYIDPKGRSYVVYESARGARFVMKQKKDSTYYKMYMPK